jgi:hypothetical protein
LTCGLSCAVLAPHARGKAGAETARLRRRLDHPGATHALDRRPHRPGTCSQPICEPSAAGPVTSPAIPAPQPYRNQQSRRPPGGIESATGHRQVRCTRVTRVTEIRPAGDAGAAQWLLRSDVDWWDLVRYGPPGFDVYVRIAFPQDSEADAGNPSGEAPVDAVRACTRESQFIHDHPFQRVCGNMGGLGERRADSSSAASGDSPSSDAALHRPCRSTQSLLENLPTVGGTDLDVPGAGCGVSLM